MMDDLFPMFMTQLWQVTLLAIFVWIVTKTCCKRRPHLGHALWLLVLIKCVVPPVFGSSASIYSWLMTHDNPKIVAERFVETAPPTAATITTFSEPKTAIAKPVETVPVVPIVNSAPTLQTPPSVVIAKRGTPAFVTPADSVQRSVAKSTSPQVVAQPIVDSKRRARSVTARALSPTPVWHSWIIKAWLLGAILFLTITVLRYLRFRSWIKRQTPVETNDIESQVSALAKKLKLRRKVRVNVVDAEFGPAVVGLLHPTIVLPNSIVAGKAAEELEPILGHELIHLRRGDIYWSVLQVVACSLMWFHPLVWLASRNVTRESEKCCDEETIANFQCDRANYARVLVDILEQKSRLRIAPVVPGVRPADITSSRLERIMESSNGICRRTPKWIWALTLLIAIVVLPGAAMVRSQENSQTKPIINPPEIAKNAFRSINSEWQMNGDAAQPRNQAVSSKPPKNPFTSQAAQRFGAGTGHFDPKAAKAQFDAQILGMAKGDDEQRKILEELKDEAWKSLCARQQLQNCKRVQVDLKLRVANMPFETESTLWKASEKISERQIPQTQLNKLLEHIGKTENSQVSAVKTITAFVGSKKSESVNLHRTFVSGIQAFSILDPENLKPQTSDLHEGVELNFAVNKDGEDSISLEGQLSFRRFQVSSGRKLPLKLGSNELKIETAQSLSFPSAFKWSIPKDQVQIVLSAADVESKSQMIVIVEASRRPALVGKDEDLTLEHVLKIKKDLPSQPSSATTSGVGSPVTPIVAEVNSDVEPIVETQVEPSKPLELVIQCGEKDKKRSLNTKIGLANNATLTIEGEVYSQQISADGVQVRGKNFVFRNEATSRYRVDDDGNAIVSRDEAARKAEGLFSAKADGGSISFNRKGRIEDTLRLSLQSNAKLQFAGVEFSADSIECWPDRIEADGNVNVSIPEISSKVSAGRVVMNLKSLAFDFDGDVKVERNVDGASFPFLVKGKHVGWSLITGEMQMDVRYSPSRSRQRIPIATTNSTFGGGTQTINRVQSGFQNGFVVPSGNRIGQVPPPNRSSQTQSNARSQIQGGSAVFQQK